MINSELWQLPQKVWQLPLKVWQLPLPSLTSSCSVLAPDSLSESLVRQPYQTASSDTFQMEETKIIWPPQNTNLHHPLNYGLCKKLPLYKCNFDQLPTFFIKIRFFLLMKKEGNWSELHS